MEKFLKLNVKLSAPIDTGALALAIQFFRYEGRLSGKKKLQDFLIFRLMHPICPGDRIYADFGVSWCVTNNN